MDDIDLVNRDSKNLNEFLSNDNNHVLGEPDFIHSCDWYVSNYISI